MSKVLPNLVASLATAAGVFVAVCVVVLLVAGMANSTPEKLRLMTRITWSVALVTLATTAAAIALMLYGKPWQGAIVGGAPVVLWIALVIVLTMLEV